MQPQPASLTSQRGQQAVLSLAHPPEYDGLLGGETSEGLIEEPQTGRVRGAPHRRAYTKMVERTVQGTQGTHHSN